MLNDKEIADFLNVAMIDLIGNTNMRRCSEFMGNANCPNTLESLIDLTGVVGIYIPEINKDQSPENVLRLLKRSLVKQLAEMMNILSQDLVTLTKGA